MIRALTNLGFDFVFFVFFELFGTVWQVMRM